MFGKKERVYERFFPFFGKNRTNVYFSKSVWYDRGIKGKRDSDNRMIPKRSIDNIETYKNVFEEGRLPRESNVQIRTDQ